MFFSDDERKIFAFNDGSTDVFGDPLELHRRINEALDYQVAEVCEQARSDVLPVADAGYKRLIAAAITAFRLFPFDPVSGKGCTEAMVMKVYNAFVEHQEGLKKKSVSTSSSTPPSRKSPPGFYPDFDQEKLTRSTTASSPASF